MQFSKFSTRSMLGLLITLSTMQSSVFAAASIDKPNTPKTPVTNPDKPTADQNKVVVPSAELAADAWRKSAPKVTPPRPFKLPTITNYKLDNGLKVQLIEDHRVPFLTVALGIKAGSALEPREKLGLAEMTADMLNEGTTSKKEQRDCQRN